MAGMTMHSMFVPLARPLRAGRQHRRDVAPSINAAFFAIVELDRIPVRRRLNGMSTVTYTEAREKLASLLNEVVSTREAIVIKRRGHADVAMLPTMNCQPDGNDASLAVAAECEAATGRLGKCKEGARSRK